jgi:hypothetical protein
MDIGSADVQGHLQENTNPPVAKSTPAQ